MVLAVVLFVLNGVIAQASIQDSFIRNAAQSGTAEAMPGSPALQRSPNEEIRRFAPVAVTCRTAANGELKTLAASKNVTLPCAPRARQKCAVDEPGGTSGMKFDKAFMKQTVKDHEAAVKLFSREAGSGTDADTKAFAAKTLPALRNRPQMARTTNDSIKSMKSDKSNNNSNSNRENSNRNSNSNVYKK